MFMPLHAEENRLRVEREEEKNRLRAERQFKAREGQKADAPKAWEEYYAAQQKLRDRTRELREQRLARAKK
jgi:hypothetical protein